jgi:hypothetical protein
MNEYTKWFFCKAWSITGRIICFFVSIQKKIKRAQSYSLFCSFSRRNLLENNKELKSIGRGKRAFLFATGPSLRQENLKLLHGEDCFSVSNFFLHSDLGLVNPKIHFFAPYHPPLVLDNYILWLHAAHEQLPKSTAICLGHKMYDLVQQHNLFPGRKIYYIYLDSCPEYENFVDLTKRILSPQTSPLMVLPALLYMGYSQIYLLGCDHTVLRDYGREVQNFYECSLDLRVNASSGKTWNPDIIADLESTKNIFVQYKFYKKIAANMKIEICNLSQDSWLKEFNVDHLNKVIRND